MISIRKAIVFLCLAFLPGTAFAQLRIATYNLSNYDGNTRANDIKTLFFTEFQGRKFAPDAIVLQEFISQFALTTFVGLLNTAPGSPGDYASAIFVDGADTDTVFCYRASRVNFLQQVIVALGSNSSFNHPRNIMRYDFRPVGYSGEAATASFYGSHMKAGSTQTDMDRRLIECQRIRDNAESLPNNRNFALGGDFNMASSNETAYQEMIGSQTNDAGRFFDPIKSPGSWGSINFRNIHTQDPAGVGGMDDRFDQILLSTDLIDGSGMDYIGNPNLTFSTTTWNDPNHSYRCWGNDGTSYNVALTVTNNANVGPVIAQALINAATTSGHLPVYLDLKVPGKASVSTTTINFGKVFQHTKPLRATLTVGNVANTTLWNTAGVANLTYSFSASPGFLVPSGPQTAAPAAAPNSHDVWLDTRTSGWKTGQIVIATNDPDQPTVIVNVTGYVIPWRGR